jgi:hypothetical protein
MLYCRLKNAIFVNINLLLIKKIYTLICTVALYGMNAQVNLASNLKLCMPFSGNALDMSGNGNNGTVSNATLTADRFNSVNSAYLFGPPNSHINVGNLSNFATNDELTISMWGKSNLTTSSCLFEIVTDTPHDRCLGAAQYANGGSTMMIWDWGSIYSSGRTTTTGIAADVANWHHYVYVVSQSGNVKQMYLDGALVSNAPHTMSCVNRNKPLYIGGDVDTSGGALRWQGAIDDVCIYNRALNANEVSALYNLTTLCPNVGIEEITGNERGMFYPAVSEDGQFRFSGSLCGIRRLSVFSIDGKLVTQFNSDNCSENRLSLQGLNSGMYLVTYSNGEKSYTQKLIINR